MCGRNDNKTWRREITTCLYRFIKENYEEVDHLILWSDSCGGQNKNFIITCMFLRLLDELPNIKYISHRFPESGHSFLPNDRDFGVLQKAYKKKDAIYTPMYIEVMEKVGRIRLNSK